MGLVVVLLQLLFGLNLMRCFINNETLAI
jgi:hypothetical protein